MLKEKLRTIPHLPGSYQMRNINNTVIYVGKAKDLYKRVNSYFKGYNLFIKLTIFLAA